MTPARHLVRIAKRLAQAWKAVEPPRRFDAPGVRDPLVWRLQAVTRAADQVERAERLHLRLIAPRFRADLDAQLRALAEAVARLRSAAESDSVAPTDLNSWVAELQQLDCEFGEVTVDWERDVLSATTDPITLEGIRLGAFAIEFHWLRVADRASVGCFDIVAVTPHPAASSPETTHPHVRDQAVCAGDAKEPIADALGQGRLADAFLLIRAVLMEYNPSSPYVKLADWDGEPCADCGQSVVADDNYYCERCGSDFCDECIGVCAACEQSRCHGCLHRCAECEAECCRPCLTVTRPGGRRLCPTCAAKPAADVAAGETSPPSPSPPENPPDAPDLVEPPPAAAAVDLCPVGVAEAPVPVPRG